jgi:predicted ATPase/DNA-binding XRE family transcriptional regulator
MEDGHSFGAWLKRRRTQLGLTQDELARRVGYSVSLLQKVEAGQRRPARQLAERLAAALALPSDALDALLERARDPRPAQRPLHNLPAPLTSFIDRADDMATLRSLLAAGRLITLSGPGGVGKTRLALNLAADLLPDTVDGVRLVELASIVDPALVPQAVAAALGLREGTSRPLIDTLAAHLRARRLLLLLDNCEHLLEACAQLAATLLHAAPELRIVATSREPLGITGETIFRVPPLSESHAVALFTERARAVRPEFALSTANRASVTNLCRRLDGLPLAIELAAARVRLLSPTQILAHLERDGDALASADRTAPPRHRSLRALLDWSYGLLTPAEQSLLQRLAVFSGGWTVDAAAAVVGSQAHEVGVTPVTLEAAGDRATLDGLTVLLDKSLIQRVDRSDDAPRFAMLETIRQYAQEQLVASGDEERVRRWHAVYFLALAESAEAELWGSRQAAWLWRLDAEHDNLRGALHHELAAARRGAGEAAERALRLASALEWFWRTRGLWNEGRTWLMRGLAVRHLVAPVVRARALALAGIIATEQYDFDVAAPLLEESAALYRACGDTSGLGWVMLALGTMAHHRGAYAEARNRTAESVALFRASDDGRGVIMGVSLLGEIALEQGELAAATEQFTEALAVHDKGVTDNRWARGWIIHWQARVAHAAGDLPRLAALLEESGQLFQESRSHNGVSQTQYLLGCLMRSRGDLVRAERALHASLAAHRDTSNHRHVANCLDELAALAAAHGRAERAARLFGAAEALREAGRTLLPPVYRPAYLREVTAACSLLDVEDWTAAWTAGRGRSREQAIDEALMRACEDTG